MAEFELEVCFAVALKAVKDAGEVCIPSYRGVLVFNLYCFHTVP